MALGPFHPHHFFQPQVEDLFGTSDGGRRMGKLVILLELVFFFRASFLSRFQGFPEGVLNGLSFETPPPLIG